MRVPDERRHIVEGVRDSEVMVGGLAVNVFVRTFGDARIVIGKVHDVLLSVLSAGEHSWPSADDWAIILPDWFVRGCAPELNAEATAEWLANWRSLSAIERVRASSERAWTLADWLYWLEPQNRTWFWWDGVIEGSDSLRLILQVDGWPVPIGALEWLLRIAGGSDIVAEQG